MERTRGGPMTGSPGITWGPVKAESDKLGGYKTAAPKTHAATPEAEPL